MRELSFEETKQVELDILVFVADFCERHGLRYFLTYGTLIGAIRHKGFIPWDDDVDIQMPREDYNELIRIFNAENGLGIYKAIAPTDKASRHAFVKIIDTRTVKEEPHLRYKELLGVDLDIFPIDGQPDDTAAFEAWYQSLVQIYQKYALKTVTPTYPKLKTNLNLIRKQLFIPSRQTLLKKAAKLHAQYPYETSRFVGTVESAYNGKGNRTQKEDYDGFVTVEFEGRAFRAPQGYDRILRNIYGDYMQLPPADKQVTHHENKVYWKE